MTITEKKEKLKTLIRDCEKVVIGYSGGVDSTFLSKISHDVLGDRLLLVTTLSETNNNTELSLIESFVKSHGIPHRFIQTSELSLPGYAENPANRCYFCKEELYKQLLAVSKQEGIETIFDGSNFDDLADYRPGRKAAREYGIRSPLVEVELTKEEIRTLSREMNLPTADRPSSPCLSSRIPYGEVITSEKILQVRKGEDFLRTLGFSELRVRHHGQTARIERGQPD